MAGGFYKLLLCEFVLQISEGSLDAGVVDQILVAPLVQEKSLALGPEQSIATGLLAVWSMKEGPKTRMLRAISAEAVRIPNGSSHHLLKFALICSLLATGITACLVKGVKGRVGPYKRSRPSSSGTNPITYQTRFEKKIRRVATLVASFSFTRLPRKDTLGN